jgi:hypothetical protein
LRTRRDGWTAAKQRGFIRALAETGVEEEGDEDGAAPDAGAREPDRG